MTEPASQPAKNPLYFHLELSLDTSENIWVNYVRKINYTPHIYDDELYKIKSVFHTLYLRR